jgi:hypothetical protein
MDAKPSSVNALAASLDHPIRVIVARKITAAIVNDDFVR